MRVVDFAEMLKESINEKINECRSDIDESHKPIYNDSLLIEIRALEWARGQTIDLVNRERNVSNNQRR
jgi:hypothetical protein